MTGYVDKVGVRVFPDTTGFEAGMKKVTGKKREALVDAVVNARKAKAELEALSKSDVAVNIDARVDEARRKVTQLRSQLATLKDQSVAIRADVASARTRIAELRAQLAETSDKDAKIKIRADIQEAQTAIKRMTAELAGNRELTMSVSADTKAAQIELKRLESDKKVVVQAQVEAAAARLELIALARRRVAEIFVRVNSSAAMVQIRSLVAGLSGFSMLKQWGSSLTNMLASLPQLSLKLATVGVALGGLTAVALTALSAIGPFASGLAQIAPLALYAGPAVGALAATIGVLAMAFSGLDKSASPAAKSFSTALSAVQTRLAGIKTAVQQAFFSSGFTEAFTRLATSVLPQLRTGLAGVATELGRMGAESMGALREVLGDNRLTGFFNNLKVGLSESSLGVANFVAGLTMVGLKGSAVFGDVGRAVTDLGTKFMLWTQSADIEGMLRNAATQAGFLGSGLRDLGGTVSAVFQAISSGGGGLQGFADTMATIRGIVEGPTFQTALSTVFAGAAQGAGALRDVLVPVGNSLAQLAPLLGQILATAGGALASVLKGIAEALAQPVAQNGIQAALTGIAGLAKSIPWNVLGQSLGIVGQAIGLIAPLVTSLLQAIAPLLPPLLTAILSLIPPLVQIVQAVLPPLVSIIGALIPVISSLAPIFAALAPVVGALANLISALLVPALQIIDFLVRTVVGPVIEFLASLITSNIQLITAVIQGDWTGAWNAAANIVSTIVTTIGSLITGLVAAAIAAIAGWASSMGAQVSAMWSNFTALVQAGITAAVSFIQSLPGKAIAALASLGSMIAGVATSAWALFNSAVNAGISNAVNFARTLPSKLLGALGSVGSLLSGAGRAIMNGLLAGLKAAWGAVQSFVGGIASWIKANKGPISVDRRLLKPAAQAIMGGFRSELAAGFSEVQGLVSSFAPSIAATVSADGSAGPASAAAGPTTLNFNVENMSVRSDSDIRRIAQGLQTLVDSKGRATGELGLRAGG